MTRRFTVRTFENGSAIADAAGGVWLNAAWFSACAYPDHAARAQAEADRLEAEHNPPPEWVAEAHFVVGPGGMGMQCIDGFSQPHKQLAARVAELLNRHGLTDGES